MKYARFLKDHTHVVSRMSQIAYSKGSVDQIPDAHFEGAAARKAAVEVSKAEYDELLALQEAGEPLPAYVAPAAKGEEAKAAKGGEGTSKAGTTTAASGVQG